LPRSLLLFTASLAFSHGSHLLPRSLVLLYGLPLFALTHRLPRLPTDGLPRSLLLGACLALCLLTACLSTCLLTACLFTCLLTACLATCLLTACLALWCSCSTASLTHTVSMFCLQIGPETHDHSVSPSSITSYSGPQPLVVCPRISWCASCDPCWCERVASRSGACV
jgi:hypothetical protein